VRTTEISSAWKTKPQIEAELNKLLDWQFIRECHNSKYVSNLVVVHRKNGSIRLYTDMPYLYKGADMQSVINKAAGSNYVC